MHGSSLAKWLRWLVYASAFVPLIIFSQYISPFHFGKVVVLRSIVEVMAVLYILLVWRDRTYLPKGHPITWAFFAFTLAFTITSITSVAWLQSFWGTLERMGGLWTFWHYFIFYIITLSVLRTRADWQRLLDIMIAVGVLSALYGFLQKTNWSFILGSGGRLRPFGTIGNAALFAGYQLLIGYLALTLSFLKRTPGNWRRWYWIAAGLTFLATASTAVRGSLLAMVVATIAAILLYSIWNRSRKARLALLFAIVAVVVFVFSALLLRDSSFVQNSPYLRRITDFSSSTFTVKTRFWAWQAGFQGWSESPRYMLVGWGPENFNVPFSEHFNPQFFTGPGSETFFDRAHNMFVEVLVTMGLLGEIAYLSLFAAIFWTLWKFLKVEGDTRTIGIGFTALTIAYMIHNAFIFDTSANFLTFFMLLAFIVHIAQRGLDAVQVRPIAGKTPSESLTAAQMGGGILLLLGALILIYTTNIKPAMANYTTTRAIVAGWQNDFPGAVSGYREAIDADTPGRYEFRHRFAQYLMELSSSADTKKIPKYKEAVLVAIEDVKKNIQENPRDYLPYLYLSRLYITIGRDDPKSPYNTSALEYSQKALEISPTFVRTYYEVGQAYLNMKDYDKAFEAFQKAAELNPDVAGTYWYMASVDFQRGKVQEGLQYATKAISGGYTLTQQDTQKLVNAYIQIGDYKSLVTIFEQLVRTFPTNVQHWASLATAYVKVNRIQDAINAARKVWELSPENSPARTDAASFIRSLGGTL
jgi:tetratricopeptide (TPR) repeat protein/O-antigen ligase